MKTAPHPSGQMKCRSWLFLWILVTAFAGCELETTEYDVHFETVDEGVRATLNKSVNLKFGEMRLSDFVSLIEQQHKVQIEIDDALLDWSSKDEPTVKADLQNVLLGEAIQSILTELDMDYIIGDEVIMIVSNEVARQNESARWHCP